MSTVNRRIDIIEVDNAYKDMGSTKDTLYIYCIVTIVNRYNFSC